MLKWCLLQDGKVSLKYKLLIFNILSKTLIFREFASEGKSARKSAKNKRGRNENSDGKTTGY